MRVIHITVKTEETQILRIKFVIVLSYLCLPTQASLLFPLSIRNDPDNNQINHSALSTSQLIKQQIDISTFEYQA